MYFIAGSFWENLIRWDQSAFLVVNRDLTNPLFDVVMPFIRNPMHWIPLYVFVLAFMLINFRLKAVWWAVFFLVTIAATDMTGFYIKEMVGRIRPCNDPSLIDQVRLLIKHCGNGPSFISNHAANHFGMATFFFITFRSISRTAAWIAIAWAAIIAFAQVYSGVHFPLDILCGALLGLAFGNITGRFFRNRFGIAIFDNQLVA